MCLQALVHFTAGRDDEHPLGPSQETAAAGGADGIGPAPTATDPIKQLSYLLLLLNVSISLPSIAALQFRQHQQHLQQLEIEQRRKQQQRFGASQDPDPQQAAQAHVQQQQGGRQDMFCGFGFSRHPEQHQQLQQLVMEAGIKAGQLLAVSGRHGMLALQRGCWRPAQLLDTTMHTVAAARQCRSCGFGGLIGVYV